MTSMASFAVTGDVGPQHAERTPPPSPRKSSHTPATPTSPDKFMFTAEFFEGAMAGEDSLPMVRDSFDGNGNAADIASAVSAVSPLAAVSEVSVHITHAVYASCCLCAQQGTENASWHTPARWFAGGPPLVCTVFALLTMFSRLFSPPVLPCRIQIGRQHAWEEVGLVAQTRRPQFWGREAR